ncbi:unnamed protein product [Adineta ricciae]|uniref:UBC core domain-containing protein n=1 Tax=Adineta ricciae TaxID=249248 RepID=A0A813Y629_ADIRI|nr:unnamed protein product [Adineta ricciae]CAF1560544.1 unnamed protein product [Adineta ricciae]
MSGSSRLNKALWTNLTRLKLLTKPDAAIKFVLEKSPFNEDDDEEPLPLERDEYCIVGRIYPNSDIYKEGAYRIQLKLTSKYPSEPPEVRFLTPIYHPNVHPNGTFCSHLLSNASRWKLNRETTLEDLMKLIARLLDEPDADYAISYDRSEEYLKNREEFKNKAMEMAKKHALPRN